MDLRPSTLKLLYGIVLIDGLFHLFAAPAIIMNTAPDWIIANFTLQFKGLPISLHRLIGAYLIGMSLFGLHALYKGLTSHWLYRWYKNWTVPATLIAIALAALIKVTS
jgi:hypothetical protein